jgi:hypothetical protein
MIFDTDPHGGGDERDDGGKNGGRVVGNADDAVNDVQNAEDGETNHGLRRKKTK